MYMRLGVSAPAMLSGVVAFSLFTGACATKKYVRNTVSPVQTQVTDVSKRTDENKASIGDLDRNVARVDEKTMEADRKAVAAGQAADKANQAANQAQSAANQAQQGVQQANQQIASVDQKYGSQFGNLDNYQLVGTEKVYFRINRSDLSKEDKAKLDQALQSLQANKNYVIEVEGFTDKTGGRALNLELARRRAETVTRYLSVDHNIPLRKIHDLGVGSDFPDADNKTRAARKENRRVEIRMYALDITGKGVPQISSTTPNPDVNATIPQPATPTGSANRNR
jgi:outer membrane protein OmpA-like peptidoglycan-associated protein